MCIGLALCSYRKLLIARMKVLPARLLVLLLLDLSLEFWYHLIASLTGSLIPEPSHRMALLECMGFVVLLLAVGRRKYWRCYAYETGFDINAGPVWLEYISFLKTAPVSYLTLCQVGCAFDAYVPNCNIWGIIALQFVLGHCRLNCGCTRTSVSMCPLKFLYYMLSKTLTQIPGMCLAGRGPTRRVTADDSSS